MAEHGLSERYSGGAYAAATGDWHDDDAAWKARHIYALAGDILSAADLVVDVGCGTGGVLNALRPELPSTTALMGFEPAPDAFRIARQRAKSGLEFRQVSIFSSGVNADTLLCIDVFEHVDDYLGFLRQLRDHAENFIFHIPLDLSLRSLWNHWPMEARETVGHLHYFTAETARATLADCGYTIERQRFTHAILALPPTALGMKIRRAPHRLLFKCDPAFCSLVLGGCSLLVLAKQSS